MKLIKTETLIHAECGEIEILEVYQYDPINYGWDYVAPEDETNFTEYTETEEILELVSVGFNIGILPRHPNDLTAWLEYTETDIFDIDRETTYHFFPADLKELQLIEGYLNKLNDGYDLEDLI